LDSTTYPAAYFRLQGCDDVTIETETRDGVANIIPDCYNDGYMECDDKPKTYWYNVNFESVVWGGSAPRRGHAPSRTRHDQRQVPRGRLRHGLGRVR
jgi:hypothetical protein